MIRILLNEFDEKHYKLPVAAEDLKEEQPVKITDGLVRSVDISASNIDGTVYEDTTKGQPVKVLVGRTINSVPLKSYIPFTILVYPIDDV